MPQSFTVARSRCSDLTNPELHEEISRHTGNTDDTAGILRCLERFGLDASVLHYEVTPRPSNRTYRGAHSITWSVSAIRETPDTLTT